ncbi:MAG: hypothetical protein V7636_348 [Actinomycetota bacterium]|jgi:hypothetical protein
MRGPRLRGWPVLAAVTIATASTLGGFTPAHAAVPVSKVGWWTRSPSPPTVPEGGLSVGVAPDGNLSVAAIGLDTAGGAAQAKVTLKETSDSQGAQAASLQICTTNDEWSAESGGDITTAPRPTCSQDPLLLKRADDGTWTADVASLIASQSGEVSIMIVPAPSAAPVPGVQTAAYQVSFDKPAVEGSVLPDTSSDDSSSFATDSSSSQSFVPPETSIESSPAFGAPVGNNPSAVLPPTQAPASVTSPNAGGGRVNFPVNGIGAETKNPSRVVIIGFVLLSLFVGAAAAAVRWAQEQGTFERLLPSGGSGMLQPPSD